jgi:apolipoprotein D and lipocalin family protein
MRKETGMLRPYMILTALALTAGCDDTGGYRDTDVPMRSVATLDTARYLGTWYEIARFPNRFEEDCTGVTAAYNLRDDGRISVTNTCRKGALDGPVEVAEGVARIAAPGQLKVKFVWWLPFEGDYWVLDVTPDYTVAVVGEPEGDFGWILARTPQIDSTALLGARAVLEEFGYDTTQLLATVQASLDD